MRILDTALSLLSANRPTSNQAGQHDSKPAPRLPLRPLVPRDPRLWLDRLERLPVIQRSIVISFVGKGGSGKSTSAVFIATIAAWLGHSVWVLDLDPQASASAWRSRRKDPAGSGTSVRVVVYRCRSRDLGQALEVARRKGVDLVLIDNQPRRHEDAVTIAGHADLSVATCGPTLFDIEETRAWLDFLSQHGLRHCVILGNAPPRRDQLDSPLVVGARRALMSRTTADPHPPAPLWSGQISRRHAVIRAVAMGSSSIEAEPSGASAVEFRGLWTFLVEQVKGAVQ